MVGICKMHRLLAMQPTTLLQRVGIRHMMNRLVPRLAHVKYLLLFLLRLLLLLLLPLLLLLLRRRRSRRNLLQMLLSPKRPRNLQRPWPATTLSLALTNLARSRCRVHCGWRLRGRSC